MTKKMRCHKSPLPSKTLSWAKELRSKGTWISWTICFFKTEYRRRMSNSKILVFMLILQVLKKTMGIRANAQLTQKFLHSKLQLSKKKSNPSYQLRSSWRIPQLLEVLTHYRQILIRFKHRWRSPFSRKILQLSLRMIITSPSRYQKTKLSHRPVSIIKDKIKSVKNQALLRIMKRIMKSIETCKTRSSSKKKRTYRTHSKKLRIN